MDWTEPRIVDLPKVEDPRGNLSFVQAPASLPFEMARCYWIFDVPAGRNRDGHAYYSQQELIVALSGSFDVHLDTGHGFKTYHLARSFYGLYVPALTWREIDNFSTNSVAMVLSSGLYDEDDYIRDHAEFLNVVNNGLQ